MDIAKVNDLFVRVKQFEEQELNEANTINYLVVPFLKAFGYDLTNPDDIFQEYPLEIGYKKVERIDFALFHGAKEPDILIECKSVGDKLEKPKSSIIQLRQYFNLITVSKIGILTNGIKYLFFTDSKVPGDMDLIPFLEADFSKEDHSFVEQLKWFSKSEWDVDEFKSSSENLRRFQKARELITSELDNPSDKFLRYFIEAIIPEVRITKEVSKVFRPIVKDAFSKHIAEVARKFFDEAQKQVEKTSGQESSEQVESDGIYTTNTEKWGEILVRNLVREVIAPERVAMRDAKSFCSILLDNNRRRTICRFFNFADQNEGDENIGKNAHVIVYNTEEGEKFSLCLIDDLFPLKDKLVEAVRRLETK